MATKTANTAKTTVSSKKSTRTNKVKDTKLTLDSLVQDGDKYDKLHRVSFEDGRYTEVHACFRPTRIDDMLVSFSEFITEYNRRYAEMKENKLMDYLSLHILLFFSTLTERTDYSFEEKVDIFHKMLDSELAETIFEHFDKTEIQKIYSRIWKKFSMYEELVQNNQELQSELLDYINNANLENTDVIKNVLIQNN
ncbi:hypothetical protein [Paenibacillus woosongensis]|uniref:Uncharacterized protein n=1 Tax=Paenibacillus woosongensis TaxID=307580 RepID=A0ABQ4MQA0_9BACL|nr:hypothetical protein [Paenibacillus woosongensis]GIP58136.1 hypothetical protein J15TS10_19500 [Paenibacillus woosongensis]